jgi:hypothetical protein
MSFDWAQDSLPLGIRQRLRLQKLMASAIGGLRRLDGNRDDF